MYVVKHIRGIMHPERVVTRLDASIFDGWCKSMHALISTLICIYDSLTIVDDSACWSGWQVDVA